MSGFRFTRFIDPGDGSTLFDRLLELFRELLVYTSGDVAEALSWMTELDREHGLTGEGYGIGDFVEELKERGYLAGEVERPDELRLSAKMEQVIRRRSLEEVFGKLRKAARGRHGTHFTGPGDELSPDRRPFEFGDSPDQIDATDSLRNAHV